MSVLWQACPVCRGSGVDPHPPANAVSCATTPCRVCGGTRLVSVVTGKPPRRLRRSVHRMYRHHREGR